MSFERIVRPFQTIPFSPTPRPAIIEPAEELEDIILEIGRSGSIKTLQGSFSSTVTAFVKETGQEISRDVVTRRVENPSDPSQFVEVEDTRRIEIESGKKDTYRVQDITFKESE